MAYGPRPVPQNIMSFEFKIFEFMNIRQFFIVMIVVAFCILLFYMLPNGWNIVIPAFILIVILVFLFLPLNGEPFHVFVSNFIDAMISPQRRVWHKKGIILKSAAEKALYYRYGEEIPLSKVMRNYTHSFNNNIGESNNQIEKAEREFLTRSDALQQEVEKYVNKLNRQDFLYKTSLPNDTYGKISLQNSRAPDSNDSKQPELSLIKRENDLSANKNEEVVDENIRNFIFGYVEDEYERPIIGASVVIRKASNNEIVEILNTNTAGGFRTNYEYPEAEFTIKVEYSGNVLIDGFRFRHNPIDPMPLIISLGGSASSDLNETNKTNSDNRVSSQSKSKINYDKLNGEVFDQEYDPKFFSVDELIQEDFYDVSSSFPKNYDSQNNAKSSEHGVVNMNYNNQASNVYSNAPSLSENLNNRATLAEPEYIDFQSLPNASLDTLDASLIYLFNTINGRVVNQNNQPIKGCKLLIYDSAGSSVNSCITDEYGNFYSLSPLENGRYFINLADLPFVPKRNFVLYIDMLGLVIPPKLIIV